ncbi:MAG: PAS domain-containing protein, partial [Nitrospinales bacterium]
MQDGDSAKVSPMTEKNPYPDKELSLRIKTILILRVSLLAVIVVLIFAFQIRAGFKVPIVPLSICVGSAFFLSLVYALLFNKCRNLATAAAAQAVGDLLVVTGFLYTTGGIQSPFSFLYILVIIASGIMLPRAASYFVASGACILYGLLVDLEYYNVIHPVYFFPRTGVDYEIGFVFYKIILNLCSFFSVAYLTSMLSERLNIVKEELSSKSADLRELQKFHQNVVLNMGNGLWTTDLTGRITSTNRAAEDITGFVQEETLGHYCYSLLEIPELKTFFWDRTLFTHSFQIENDCRGKDQKHILIRMKVSRLLERDGQVKGFICVFEDLTEFREMERKIHQTEKLAALGKISAGLAHELRNPLASLSGSIQFLQKELKINGTNKRLMEIVTKETERLNSIVTDFLNYSHP